MRANRRAGMTKLTDDFRDFALRLVWCVCVLLDCIPLVILHAVECGLWRYAQQAPELCSMPPTLAQDRSPVLCGVYIRRLWSPNGVLHL
jgi:hypothetical protein